MRENMKIAIFGGSFNPVHNEHINIVKAVKKTLAPDKIIIMPSSVTPQKYGKMTASAADRINMCKMAFCGMDEVEISDYEIAKGGVSYSYITCRALREKYPEGELYFVTGCDMLKSFAEWKYPEEILKCVKLAACARENRRELNNAEKDFKKRFGCGIVNIDYTGAKVSSTRIRVLSSLGESISGFVPAKIESYISNRSLYLLSEISAVKKYLTPPRWAHTVRVAVTAAENCTRLGIDEKTAVIAAALHDCAKYLTPDAEELKGFVCPADVPQPVIHQYAGEYVARNTFGITDENILNAIRYHASGREDMSGLEKLIYLSDMLEEGRNFSGVEKLREEFSHSIDGGLFSALEHQLDYLKSTGGQIYPLTQRAYDYLRKNKNDK